MSNKDFYGGGPQYPQQSYQPPQGPPPGQSGYYPPQAPYGGPQGGYGGPQGYPPQGYGGYQQQQPMYVQQQRPSGGAGAETGLLAWYAHPLSFSGIAG
jgi:hypothetical protein